MNAIVTEVARNIANVVPARFYLGGVLQSVAGGNIATMKVYAGGLAVVTADGVNTITVDSVARLSVGMFIDILRMPTGGIADSISARQITAINPATKVVTYSGADQLSVAGTDIVVPSGYVLTGNMIDTFAADPTSTYTLVNRDSLMFPVAVDAKGAHDTVTAYVTGDVGSFGMVLSSQ